MKRKLAAAFALMILASSLSAAAQEGSGLKITIGKPFTLWKNEKHRDWGPWNFPELRKCADGSLLLRYHAGGDRFGAIQEAPSLYRSHDLGKTWRPDPMGELKPLSPRMRAAFKRFNSGEKGKEPLDGMWLSGFCNLSDGTSVAYWHQAMVDDAPTRYINGMWHSPDGGTTWKGPVDVELTGPANVFGQGHEGQGPALWRRSVQLDNGDLITVVVCRFEGDKKLRVTALGSSDKGRHWRHLGTVAHDETINTEGFCEPIICKLADEELICFMRTQGHQPMYQSYSRDGGKTWTKPIKSGVLGVAPDMHLMSNGVLVCSYGRPGANIMFGADGTGRKWTDHTTIYAPVPPTLRGRSTYYTSFEEVSPGRLFLVFDVINYKDAPDTKPANCIRGVYIDVQRVK